MNPISAESRISMKLLMQFRLTLLFLAINKILSFFSSFFFSLWKDLPPQLQKQAFKKAEILKTVAFFLSLRARRSIQCAFANEDCALLLCGSYLCYAICASKLFYACSQRIEMISLSLKASSMWRPWDHFTMQTIYQSLIFFWLIRYRSG